MKRAVVLAIVVGACGTPPPTWTPDAGECVAYAPPGGTDLMTPTISFKTAVMPVFAKSCSSSICHGIASSPQGGLFLGAELAKGSDSEKVYAGLVAHPSGQLPAMSFVTAGDPANSYLMHKLDGDQCMFQTTCVAHDCLKAMPYDTGSLGVDTRDIVRRWIAQGAQDN